VKRRAPRRQHTSSESAISTTTERAP
jgi:hypothetical protein